MQAPVIAELKAHREALGWSIAHVAERCGIDENSLEEWERGVGSPRLEALLAWAACFGLRLGLIARSEEPRQGLRIDWDKRQITVGGAPVRLTPMEWKALELLARVPGELVTHEALFRHLYGDEQPYRPESTAIRVLITKLRRLLPLRIEARWGRGYVVSSIASPPPADRGTAAEEQPEQPDEPEQRPGKPQADRPPALAAVAVRASPWREAKGREAEGHGPGMREPAAGELPARQLPHYSISPDRRPTGGEHAGSVHAGPRPVLRPAQPSPCREKELDVIARFLAERGATRCPDVATIERSPLPTLIWDRNKRKWVRPAHP